MEYQLIEGDCLDVLKGMPDQSVDAVVTDPPYGTGAWLRPEPGSGRNCKAIHKQEEWDCWSTDWLDHAWRVSSCAVGLFVPNVKLPSLWDWIGNKPKRLFIWCKTDPRPRFNKQPAFGFNPFVIIGKVQPCGGKDWFAASSPRSHRDHEATGHPHQKRVSVMEWALNLACPPDGTILDPFAGSGSTGVAALRLGRKFIGIEISGEYVKIAERRLRDAQAQSRIPFAPMYESDGNLSKESQGYLGLTSNP